jgi:sulfur-oxidizing protein SoxX
MYYLSTCLRAVGAGLILTAALTQSAYANGPKVPTGQELAFDNRKGNCLACHMMPSDPAAVTSADIAPPLVGMRGRFPDRAKLRAQIWDATKTQPDSLMPAFGKHKILTEEEFDKVLDYVYEL